MADNLLDKASILLTPTAYNDAEMLSIKPENGDGDFTFSRGSAATRVNAQGLVENVQTISDELVSNGNFSQGSQDWSVLDSDSNNYVEFNQEQGTARLKFLNTSPLTELQSTTLYASGKKYKLIVDVAEVVSGGVKIDAAGVSQTYNSVGVQESIIQPSGTTFISFYRATANVDITLNSVSLKEITDDTDLPRIDYTDGCGSWLLEPQSTNLITNSNLFTSWNKEATVTLTANYGISPDGTQNSTRMQMNANDSIYISKTSGLTASVYVKGTEGETIRISNGSALTHTLSGQWDRIQVYDSGSSSTLISINTYSGATARDIEIFGAQVEAQSYATSYIPTNGTTVTRLQDVANNSGNASLINSTEGVLYAEIAALADDGTFRVIGLTDGSVTNRVNILFDTPSNSIRVIIRQNNITSFDTSISLTSTLDFHKIAVKYKSNDFAFWIDGVEVATDTSGATPIGLDRVTFDTGNDTLNFYGKCKALAVFPILTNAQLQSLTTI